MFNAGREIDQVSNSIANRFFRGKCVDNNDPLHLGRIRVKVEGIHDNYFDDQIPWSMCGLNMTCNTGSGGLCVPEINTWVWVLYCSEQLDSSLYFGASYTQSSTLQEELEKDYPYSYGFVDADNNVFVVNRLRGYTRLLLKHGGEVTMHSNGLYIKTSDEYNDSFPEGFQLHVNGVCKVISNTKIDVQSPEILFISDKFEIKTSELLLNASGNTIVKTNTLSLNSQTFTSNSTSSTLSATSSMLVQSSASMKVVGGGGSYDATGPSKVDGKAIGMYQDTGLGATMMQFYAFAPSGSPESPSPGPVQSPEKTNIALPDASTSRGTPTFKDYESLAEFSVIKQYDDASQDDNPNNLGL